jgi:hypothetical protein
MQRRLSSAISLAASLAALALPSLAGAKPHDGLLLRATPGVSAAAATTTVDETDYSLSGGAGQLGLMAGWAVAPRLIITGELLGHAIFGPDLEVDDDVMETDDDEVTWGISYAGLGATYYFKSNAYIGASGGALIMTLDTDGDEDDVEARTDVGGAGKLTAGYEWWVGPEFGLGAGLELLAGAVPDGEEDVTWGVATLGLALSATYN